MGIPNLPLRELYAQDGWDRVGRVRLHPRSAVTAIQAAGSRMTAVCAGGEVYSGYVVVSALPFARLPPLGIAAPSFSPSPITGIHLWFDRSITQLPHATLLDRTIQWMFNKSGGRYLQLVVSASRSLVDMNRADVIALAVRELAEFFPRAADAKIEKAHVVKEVRATFSARPGLEPARPVS